MPKGSKGKGKAPAQGKGKEGNDGADNKKKGGKDKLKTCNHVKGRHILCEKQGKLLEAYETMKQNYLDKGMKVPPADFAKFAEKISECPSAKRGGDLGWFPRGKMNGDFQDVAFSTPPGELSQPFKAANGWHIFLCEGRKA
mmetsp:Transcript_48937/g.123110  ORF Transcript_48937/g.123110 Transcript_48937/m.123110 type:complete len:141 (+) Transcript_48937:182-604(+)|eukprot:CAMPEP_0177681904 /NCGR_PEP_ID=MMETSP0447-20121125/30975_1 /TAXON_ID=0 /ORGANISM="Stygamoeba regulata, Strain BSH-02190019" /LENGTH=140 /DNA_ID=CAMNT_0019191373 /DNA_START=169 /DNA_END=591 /DNA_ORIENTATION=+